MSRYSILFFFLMVMSTGQVVYAQDTPRYTEEDIKVQELFLAAQKEKLSGKTEEAISLFEEVIDKDRDNAAAAYQLSKLYAESDKNELALKYAQKAVRYEPANIWYNKQLAELYQDNAFYDRAAGVYADLTQKHPDNENFYYEWAYFLHKAGKQEEAVQVYEQLEERIGVNLELSRKKQTLYLNMGRVGDAVEEARKLTEKFPQNLAYKHQLADLLVGQGLMKKAEEIYRDILALNPDDSEAKLALAETLFAAKKYKEYLREIEPMFKDPSLSIDRKIASMFPFVDIMNQAKDSVLTRLIIDRAHDIVEAHPTEAKAYAMYGDMLSNSGQRQAALEQYEKTIDLDPSVFTVWEQMFYLTEESGDMEALLNLTDKALDFFPNQGKVYYFKGLAEATTGDVMKGIASLEQALAMSRRHPLLSLDILKTLADIYYENNMFERAKKRLNMAMGIGGDQVPSILERYGDVLFKLDQPEEALSYWKQAADKGGSSRILKQKISTGKLVE